MFLLQSVTGIYRRSGGFVKILQNEKNTSPPHTPTVVTRLNTHHRNKASTLTNISVHSDDILMVLVRKSSHKRKVRKCSVSN